MAPGSPTTFHLGPKLRLGPHFPEALLRGIMASMTRSRYRIFETEYPYFLTNTIVGWLPLFTRPEAVDILHDSWRHCQRQRGLMIFGYVILENHLHLIASAPDLSTVMQNFKSFTARSLIDLLERQSSTGLLRQLEAHKLRHKADSDYQVWQEGNHPEQIRTEAMMWQKLEYVHNNPVARGYVDDPLHWRYSSARNYAGLPGLIDVITDWR
ncbi:MAG TPA: transposase [Planctomycetaceae bacterium]|nr:transposase [Planctomycetaceae bacterium]